MQSLLSYTKGCTTPEDILTAASRWISELLQTAQKSYGFDEVDNDPSVCAFDDKPLSDLCYTKCKVDDRAEYWFSADGVDAIAKALAEVADHTRKTQSEIATLIESASASEKHTEILDTKGIKMVVCNTPVSTTMQNQIDQISSQVNNLRLQAEENEAMYYLCSNLLLGMAESAGVVVTTDFDPTPESLQDIATLHEAKIKELLSTIQHLNDQVSAHKNTQDKRIAALESMVHAVNNVLGLPKIDKDQFSSEDGMRSTLSACIKAINTLKSPSIEKSAQPQTTENNPAESQPIQDQQDKIKELEAKLLTSEKRIASLLEERKELRGRVADADALIGRMSRTMIAEGVIDLPE